ncbi:MAG: putative zinc-binding protein [Desulfobacterales bacterium]
MPQDCCASNNNVMLLSCSGGSNVGQLSNRAAVELTQEGFGKMYCLAGIGGRLKGFVQSAKDVPVIAAIDGCSVGCAKAILKNADISSYNHIVLTDLGIEKNKNFDLSDKDLMRVKEAVVAACNSQKSAAETSALSKVVGCCG